VVNFDSKTLNQSIEDEKKASKNTLNTPDWQEGMAAFSEKRRPVFNQDQDQE
jgi:enoyl-CoA hydratase/carnithine racemase